MITEPDVTLTDYFLALECAVFACLLYFKNDRLKPFRLWFAIFLGALSLAAALGGTVHGFFVDESTAGYKILWPATLVALGLAALAGWGISSRMIFSPETARKTAGAAAVLFLVYSVVVVFVNQSFLVAILHYLPSVFFLLIAWLSVYRRARSGRALAGVFGLALFFVAAGAQQARIALHPVYFNHNALYHVIQAVAIFLVFYSARWYLSEGEKR
jgi:hypothetical protein